MANKAAVPDREWFERVRWPAGSFCPRCGGSRISTVKFGVPLPYRCQVCNIYFDWMTRAGALAGSSLPLSKLRAILERMSRNGTGDTAVPLWRACRISGPTATRLARKVFAAEEEAGYPARRRDGPPPGFGARRPVFHRIASVDASPEQILRALIDYPKTKRKPAGDRRAQVVPK